MPKGDKVSEGGDVHGPAEDDLVAFAFDKGTVGDVGMGDAFLGHVLSARALRRFYNGG